MRSPDGRMLGEWAAVSGQTTLLSGSRVPHDGRQQGPETADGHRRLALTSPVTLEPIGELVCASEADVKAAVAKARKAQPAWAAKTIEERVQHLLKLREVILANQELVVETVIRETGKPLQDALTFEVYAVCDFISYWCKQARKTLKDEVIRAPGLLGLMKKVHLIYRPLGVIGGALCVCLVNEAEVPAGQRFWHGFKERKSPCTSTVLRRPDAKFFSKAPALDTVSLTCCLTPASSFCCFLQSIPSTGFCPFAGSTTSLS